MRRGVVLVCRCADRDNGGAGGVANVCSGPPCGGGRQVHAQGPVPWLGAHPHGWPAAAGAQSSPNILKLTSQAQLQDMLIFGSL
jgi:hypothetical protein